MIEIDRNKVDVLVDKYHNKKNRGWERGYIIECADFLNKQYMVSVQKIIMNPPFSKSQDVKHILEAYKHLRDWGRLVSVASSSIHTRSWKI